MGFKVSGIAIDKNYQDNLQELADILEVNLDRESAEEVIFERAFQSYADGVLTDYELYIYFCPTGTLVFGSENFTIKSYSIENQKCASFILLESQGMISLQVTKDEEPIRTIIETGGMLDDEDTGEPLEEDNGSEVFGAIKYVLGKSYFDIDLEEPVLHFTDVD